MNLFRPQAIEHRKQRLYGDVILSPRISHTLILGGLLLWVGLLFLWLFICTYTEHEVARGWLELPEDTVRVYPEDAGFVKKLFVAEGEQVLEGQKLMMLSIEPKLNTRQQLNLQLLQGYVSNCQSLQEYLANIALSPTDPDKHFDVKIKVDSREINMPGALVVETAELCERFNSFMQQDIVGGGQYDHILKAAQSGIVSNLRVREGQQVPLDESNPLLLIIPNEAKFKASLLIPARLADSLKQGQLIDVHYDVFSHLKAGVSQGIVEHISNTILLPIDVQNTPIEIKEPVYEVSVRLLSPSVQVYGKNLPIKPGMTLSADIRSVDRKLIQWFLSTVYELK